MKGEKQSNRLLVFCKISLNLIFVFLIIHIAGSKASAHKVNIFAYIEGDTVFTEIQRLRYSTTPEINS
jgi:hypothetical protein